MVILIVDDFSFLVLIFFLLFMLIHVDFHTIIQSSLDASHHHPTNTYASAQFRTQDHPAYCGLASLAMACAL